MADEQDDGENGGKSSKKLLIIGLLGVVVLGLAGAGVWFFLLAGDTADVSEAEVVTTPVLGPVQYVDLSPAFIVNFPHRGRQRFMQATISVMGRDAEAMAAVTQHMPAIRHNLINLMSTQLVLVFENPAGIEALRRQATEEVKQVLQREIGRPGIEEVLFTSFVMQ